MIGQSIGRYRITRQIGEGGFGTVYEGIHEQIERRAAIKTLHAQFSQKKEMAQRFLNEARAVNIIKHPGIINVFEFGQLEDGTAYIIMEFLEGITLSARLKDPAGLSYADTIRVTRHIASAVAAAHEKGIVHRDLKPDNVMIVPDADIPGRERIKVLDFGIAKLMQGSQAGEAHIKTRTGVTIGTPAYMSPEQCRGEREVDEKSDVYSLGVMLYQMLCGRRPFDSEGVGAVIAMHIYESARPIQEWAPSIPTPLATLVHAMMAKKPEARPTMKEVAAELGRLADTVMSGRLVVARPGILRNLYTPPMLGGGTRSVALFGGTAATLGLVAALGWPVWHSGGTASGPGGTQRGTSELSRPVPVPVIDQKKAPSVVPEPAMQLPREQPGPAAPEIDLRNTPGPIEKGPGTRHRSSTQKFRPKGLSRKPDPRTISRPSDLPSPPLSKPAPPVIERTDTPRVDEKPKPPPESSPPKQQTVPKKNDAPGYKPFF